ncbi:MFS transporter [Spirillospora sp. NPDC050679]
MTALRLAASPALAPLLAARLISSAGVGFGQVAFVWGMKALHYSPSEIAAVAACKAVPALLILAGGVIGDRFRRHHVLAAVDLAAGGAWLAIGTCLATGRAPLPVLCLLALLAGTAHFVFLPVVRGIVADLLPPERRHAGNALVGQTEAAGLLIGLACAGLVVGSFGPAFAAVLKAALCVLSSVLLLRLTAPRRRTQMPGPLTDLRESWRLFLSRGWIWAATLQFTAVVIATATFVEIIGPLAVAERGQGARTWGFVAACEAVGALAGAALAVRLRPGRPIIAAAGLMVLTALPMLLTGSGAPAVAVAAGMLASGMAKAVYLVLWLTELQKVLPIETLARVNGWSIVPAYALAPVALVVVGPVVEAGGPGSTAIVIGTGVLLTTVAVLTGLLVTARTDGSPAKPEANTVSAS